MRTLKFIAWDKNNSLIKRLGKVELEGGELSLNNHIILQFTGHVDKLGQEIYDRDILLSNGEVRAMVVWSKEINGWALSIANTVQKFDVGWINNATRLYNYYEKEAN